MCIGVFFASPKYIESAFAYAINGEQVKQKWHKTMDDKKRYGLYRNDNNL